MADLEQEIEIPDGITLHDAGHIVGARQIRVEDEEGVSVYTGDYRINDSIFGKGAEVLETDFLMLEAIYGDPSFRFPKPFDVYEDLSAWIRNKKEGSNILIGAYRMGKSQEIIRVLNKYLDIVPIVGSGIYEVVEKYNELGHKLEAIKIGSDEAEGMLKDSFVAILPTGKVNRELAQRLEHAHKKACYSVAVTGWSQKYRLDVDVSFPLSDHSDYYDAVDYLKESKAKKVMFFDTGYDHLEKTAKSLGMEIVKL
ncbi:MAG: hypothetical protein NTY68_03515 [Candidatus Micrarchaeota archaeon]|nr:hypothetical protein [Candidatus Micrarchaeota archaeon]